MSIQKVTLELTPDAFVTVRDSLSWYHESLHMQVDPDVHDPSLPIEQLTRPEKKRRIIKLHHLLKEMELLDV